LNIDQVNKLAPFMVELRKTGDAQSFSIPAEWETAPV
jgi:hypothetical protein